MQMDTSHNGTNSHHRWSPLHQLSHIWLQGLYKMFIICVHILTPKIRFFLLLYDIG